MTIKTIGIIGVGGVGGYFGGKLCRAKLPEQRVCFLARGNHLTAIRENGLTVKTVSEGDFTCHPDVASDNIGDFPPLDFCIIAVKGYDLNDTLKALKKRVSERTVILPLLNGIDIDERIREVIPDATVLPGCAYISSHIEEPGLVVQTGGPCTIVFGRNPHHPDFSPEGIRNLFESAGINHQFAEEPYPRIWEKYLFIAPFSLVTACFDKTIGEVIASTELSRHVRGIMDEIVRLAERKGIPLAVDTAGDAFEKAKGFPQDTRTSFQNDFVKPDKRDEREIFGETILKLCDRAGLSCEVTRAIYQKLTEKKPLQQPV